MKWKQKLNSVKQQYHYIIMNVPPLAVKYYKQVGAFYSGSPITNSPTTHTRTVPVLSKKVYPLPLRRSCAASARALQVAPRTRVLKMAVIMEK
jgi:hypothetical protein